MGLQAALPAFAYVVLDGAAGALHLVFGVPEHVEGGVRVPQLGHAGFEEMGERFGAGFADVGEGVEVPLDIEIGGWGDAAAPAGIAVMGV